MDHAVVEVGPGRCEAVGVRRGAAAAAEGLALPGGRGERVTAAPRGRVERVPGARRPGDGLPDVDRDRRRVVVAADEADLRVGSRRDSGRGQDAGGDDDDDDEAEPGGSACSHIRTESANSSFGRGLGGTDWHDAPRARLAPIARCRAMASRIAPVVTHASGRQSDPGPGWPVDGSGCPSPLPARQDRRVSLPGCAAAGDQRAPGTLVGTRSTGSRGHRGGRARGSRALLPAAG